MQLPQDAPPSTFAQIVDKLRNKSEEELTLLNLKFFSKELNDEWETITGEADFKTDTEEAIIKAKKKPLRNKKRSGRYFGRYGTRANALLPHQVCILMILIPFSERISNIILFLAEEVNGNIDFFKKYLPSMNWVNLIPFLIRTTRYGFHPTSFLIPMCVYLPLSGSALLLLKGLQIF